MEGFPAVAEFVGVIPSPKPTKYAGTLFTVNPLLLLELPLQLQFPLPLKLLLFLNFHTNLNSHSELNQQQQ